jgi:hypothetical protein
MKALDWMPARRRRAAEDDLVRRIKNRVGELDRWNIDDVIFVRREDVYHAVERERTRGR